mmetsp:Transcript_23301/g.67225  ORF Transcript_23301/g.67225 Transcript_23301/m.67225 type:complete len:183 (+) Transcript_23301:62-610(+)
MKLASTTALALCLAATVQAKEDNKGGGGGGQGGGGGNGCAATGTGGECFNRADAEGCISNPNHCADTGQSGCCVSYTIPFCGDPNKYGAAAPAGSIKCMTDEPVPLSAAPPSDIELSVVAEAFDTCLDQLNATEITSLNDCTALSDLVEAAKAMGATSSGNSAKVAAALGASLVAGVGALLN